MKVHILKQTGPRTQRMESDASAYKQMKADPWPVKWRWSNWETAVGNEFLSKCQDQYKERNQSGMTDKTVCEPRTVILGWGSVLKRSELPT